MRLRFPLPHLLLGDGDIGAILLGLVLVALGGRGGSSAVSTGALKLGASLDQELAKDAQRIGRPAS